MDISIFFARFFGISFVIICLGILINHRYYQVLWQHFLEQPFILLLAGIIDIFVGLAVVLLHNLWVSDWRVLITLVGWLLLIRGSARVLIPRTILKLATAIIERKHYNMINTVLAIFVIIGLFLAYKGFIAPY